MAPDEAEIRILTAAELAELVGWAAVEGWNPGLMDTALFQNANPNGFLGCFVNDRLAAGIAAVRYDDLYGFIGLYICHPDFRGQGLGRKIWDAGMAHLKGVTIGLDGVVEQQGNYRRMGFAPVYDSVRWSLAVTPAIILDDPSIRPVGAADFADIIAFDRDFFPAKRDLFLTGWLQEPHRAFVRRHDDRVTGYAVLRRCLAGYKIGPLFARHDRDAVALFHACLTHIPGAELHLDVPEYQVGFGHHLEQTGFTPGFRTARMYRGEPPKQNAGGVFAVTTLELG